MRVAVYPIVYFASLNYSKLGLLAWIKLPVFLQIAVSILILDYAFYLWHLISHRQNFLWRFHLVHHTDLDLDASTAFRFHFAELTLASVFRILVVIIFGIQPFQLVLFEVIMLVCVLFHHSNMRLPKRFEVLLWRVLITPRLHGIHHSMLQPETNSNFGTVFSFWDRLHRTRIVNVVQRQITIGVPAYQKELTLWQLLGLPFQSTQVAPPQSSKTP